MDRPADPLFHPAQANLEAACLWTALQGGRPWGRDESLSWADAGAAPWPKSVCRVAEPASGDEAALLAVRLSLGADQGQLPGRVWLRPDSPGGSLTRRALEAAGWHKAVTNTLMDLDLDGLVRPDLPEGLTWRRVLGAADLLDWCALTAEHLWQQPEAAGAAAGLFGAVADTPVFALWLARLEGQPAVSAALFRHNDTVGLYHVAVPPALRGRGLARSFTAALLAGEAARGARRAVLHASAPGRPVYEALGFRTGALLERWHRDTMRP